LIGKHSMPKKGGSSKRNIALLLVIVIVVTIGIIASHDGLIGATSIPTSTMATLPLARK